MGKNRTLRYLGHAYGNFMRFWQQKAPFCRGKAGYQFANTSLRGQFGKCELVGVKLRHLAIARPFCRLKAPLGLSLLHFVSQTRTCRSLVVYLIMAYTAKPRNGQDRSLQLILCCGANIQMICRTGCPHPAAEKPC